MPIHQKDPPFLYSRIIPLGLSRPCLSPPRKAGNNIWTRVATPRTHHPRTCLTQEKPRPAHTVQCVTFPQPLFFVQFPNLSSYARPKYRSGPPLPHGDGGTTERVSPTAVVFRMGGSKTFDGLSRSRSINGRWSHGVTWRLSPGQDHLNLLK